MKFYTYIKQENIYLATKFCKKYVSEYDKIMLFQLRQHPFLYVRASCRTGCKRTDSLRRMSDPKLSRFEPVRLSRLGRHTGKVS